MDKQKEPMSVLAVFVLLKYKKQLSNYFILPPLIVELSGKIYLHFLWLGQ